MILVTDGKCRASGNQMARPADSVSWCSEIMNSHDSVPKLAFGEKA